MSPPGYGVTRGGPPLSWPPPPSDATDVQYDNLELFGDVLCSCEHTLKARFTKL